MDAGEVNLVVSCVPMCALIKEKATRAKTRRRQEKQNEERVKNFAPLRLGAKFFGLYGLV